jgi:hypothetical protein
VSGVDGAKEGTHAPGESGVEWTYHSKEVLDAAGVDGVQRGDLDAQQRVFGSERHDCGSEEVSSCAVCGERDGCWCTLMGGVWVGMRVGLVLLWLRDGRMEVAGVSVTSARAWGEGCMCCVVLECCIGLEELLCCWSGECC